MDKRLMAKVLFIAAFLYLFSVVVIFAPYYNWKYMKENGMEQWIKAGELVATGKAFIWPYYTASDVSFAFFGPAWTEEDRACFQHYRNSKKACDEAIRLVTAVGDISKLDEQQSQSMINALQLSSSEANLVKDSFLAKVHPEMQQKYTEGYKNGLQMILIGLQTKSNMDVLGGSFSYNEFARWIKNNRKNIKLPGN